MRAGKDLESRSGELRLMLMRLELCREDGLEHQRLGLAYAVFETFAQDGLGARVAFTAAGAYAQFCAQLRHRRDTGIDGLADFAFRDVIANTDDHCAALGGGRVVVMLFAVLFVPVQAVRISLFICVRRKR